VRVVDVHDMELRSCRGGACDINASGYDPYPVVRNRARIDVTYAAPTTGPVAPSYGPVVAPQFEIGTSVILVKADGTTNDPRTSGLDCIPCPTNQAVSFPISDEVVAVDGGTTEIATTGGVLEPLDGGAMGATNEVISATGEVTCAGKQGRVCSLADPWVDPGNWGAVYEGNIPGTRGGRGRFVDSDSPDNQSGSLEFVGEVHFCQAGVLGDQDISTGDQLEITSVLPTEDPQNGSEPQVRAACQTLVQARDTDNSAIAFRIKAAYDDHLLLEPALINVPRDIGRVTPDWNLVRQCFDNMLLAYQVHTRESYVVLGAGDTSFQHRVIRNADSGRCQVDETQDARHSGRAYTGEQFDNGFISFKTKTGTADPGTLLRLTSASNTPKLLFDVGELSTGEVRGVMPVDLKFSPIAQQLFVVDITARGLVVVPLSPMPRAVDTSFQ
jgi:hypothetical protein